jgi:hypothetical protein
MIACILAIIAMFAWTVGFKRNLVKYILFTEIVGTVFFALSLVAISFYSSGDGGVVPLGQSAIATVAVFTNL